MKLSIVAVAVLLLSGGGAFAQTPAPDAQSTANPQLVRMLADELGATPSQAEGAAGSLFAAAKSRMKTQDWAQVARVVPGMAGLLQAAPNVEVGTSGELGSLANAVGLGGAASGLGTLAAVTAAFQKLGLSPELVTLAVPVVTKYVQQKGGAKLAQVLAGALK